MKIAAGIVREIKEKITAAGISLNQFGAATLSKEEAQKIDGFFGPFGASRSTFHKAYIKGTCKTTSTAVAICKMLRRKGLKIGTGNMINIDLLPELIEERLINSNAHIKLTSPRRSHVRRAFRVTDLINKNYDHIKFVLPKGVSRFWLYYICSKMHKVKHVSKALAIARWLGYSAIYVPANFLD